MTDHKSNTNETQPPPIGFWPHPPPYNQYGVPNYQGGEPYTVQNPGPTNPAGPIYTSSLDVEGQPGAESHGFEFNDKTIRRAFIRKVYFILMVQISISFGCISLFVFHEPTVQWVIENPFVILGALLTMIATMIVIICSKNVRRKAPMNYILLAVFTLAVSFLLGVVSAGFEAVEVLLAVGITAVLCLALTLFAFQTKWDFTMLGGSLYVACLVLMMFGILVFIIPVPVLSLLYASLGALLFSIYLIYDTQMLMGGDHKYAISPEEYVAAALTLYMDIVNIFLFILRFIR